MGNRSVTAALQKELMSFHVLQAATHGRRVTFLWPTVWIACLISLASLHPARAQDATGGSAQPVNDSDSSAQPETLPTLAVTPLATSASVEAEEAKTETLAPVVITAARGRSDVMRTPISVTVTRDETLRQTDITDIEALSARLPNAQLALTPTNTFLFVRGLGTGGVRSAEQSVGFFVDSVFLGRPQVALFDFLDVKQVELLRGPQGALLGKNTVAGAVNVQTAPVTREREGYVEALTGSFGARRLRGALSGALSETLAARVAYSQTDEDGTLFNTTQQRQDLARPGHAGRFKLRWQPAPDTGLGLTVQSARIRQIGDSFELSRASEQTLALYRQFDPETSTDINNRQTHTDHRASGARIAGEDVIGLFEHKLERGDFSAVVSHSVQDSVSDFDLDISPAPLLNFPSVEGYRQSSAEVRRTLPLDWGQLAFGAYYFQADLDLQVDIRLFEQGADRFAQPLLENLTGLPLDALRDVTGALPPIGFGQSRHLLIQRQRTMAAFGSVRWDVTRRWQLQFDGRITRETKRGDQGIVFSGVSGPLLGRVLGEEEYRLLASREEVDFSPRLSALFEIMPKLTSYLTVARGFKSGGFNNLAAVPERAEFDEERSLTFEAGIRSKPWYGLRGAAQFFHTRFQNLQVAALDGTEFFVGNAARAHTQGVEISASWLTPLGFALSGEFGFLDARYDRYEDAPARADSDEDSQDLSGRVLQRAPRFTGSVQLDYRVAPSLLPLPLALGVVAEGASHQFLNIDLDPIDSQPGYLRYNAYAALSDASQHLTLRLIGRNLSDQVVRREAADIAIVGAHSVGLFPPRTLAVELSYRF